MQEFVRKRKEKEAQEAETVRLAEEEKQKQLEEQALSVRLEQLKTQMQGEIDGLKADLTKAKSTVKSLQGLRGRKVAVTGALRGCGPAIVKRLLMDGASVIAADRGMSNDEAAAAGLRGGGEGTPNMDAFTAGRLVFFDMGGPGDEDGACRLAELCQESFGGMDGLVCNTAAMPGASSNPLEDLEPSDWADALTGALTEPMLATKHALPLLQAACSKGTVGAGGGGGAIVNVVYTASRVAGMNSETLATAGGGLARLTHSLAASSWPHVRVNAVSVPEGSGRSSASGAAGGRSSSTRKRSGKDAASAVSFLLSNHAGSVTGQNLAVDGSLSRRA
ncbi:unnamed protein product [Laminaria digitata]